MRSRDSGRCYGGWAWNSRCFRAHYDGRLEHDRQLANQVARSERLKKVLHGFPGNAARILRKKSVIGLLGGAGIGVVIGSTIP